MEFDGRDWQVKKLSKPGNPPDPYIDGTIANIWASQRFLYVISGIGVLRESIKTGARRLYHWQEIGLPIGFSYGAYGTGDNNLFVVGEFGTILHFNGISWQKYLFFNLTNGPRLLSVNSSENLVVVVGLSNGGRAIIFRGAQ